MKHPVKSDTELFLPQKITSVEMLSKSCGKIVRTFNYGRGNKPPIDNAEGIMRNNFIHYVLQYLDAQLVVPSFCVWFRSPYINISEREFESVENIEFAASKLVIDVLKLITFLRRGQPIPEKLLNAILVASSAFSDETDVITRDSVLITAWEALRSKIANVSEGSDLTKIAGEEISNFLWDVLYAHKPNPRVTEESYASMVAPGWEGSPTVTVPKTGCLATLFPCICGGSEEQVALIQGSRVRGTIN